MRRETAGTIPRLKGCVWLDEGGALFPLSRPWKIGRARVTRTSEGHTTEFPLNVVGDVCVGAMGGRSLLSPTASRVPPLVRYVSIGCSEDGGSTVIARVRQNRERSSENSKTAFVS